MTACAWEHACVSECFLCDFLTCQLVLRNCLWGKYCNIWTQMAINIMVKIWNEVRRGHINTNSFFKAEVYITVIVGSASCVWCYCRLCFFVQYLCQYSQQHDRYETVVYIFLYIYCRRQIQVVFLICCIVWNQHNLEQNNILKEIFIEWKTKPVSRVTIHQHLNILLICASVTVWREVLLWLSL